MKKTRAQAREQIVQAANRYLIQAYAYRNTRNGARGVTPTMVSGRQINRAVRICRHNRLVKPEVLAAAGFRERRESEAKSAIATKAVAA